MNFITFSFLTLGAAAALIPIVLHFLMKGKAKKIEFPALRFVRAAVTQNQRRYTFRHFLLLMLRILVLFLFGLTLARPSIREDLFSGKENVLLPTTQNAPTAAVFVLDTSLRMNVVSENISRISTGQQYIQTLLERLPQGSEVAVLFSGEGHDSFQIDLSAAKEAIDKAVATSPVRSLPDSIIEAVRLLRTSKLQHRELFIITDRSSASWPVRRRDELIRQLSALRQNASDDEEFPSIYLLDCAGTETAVSDSAILNAGLSSETGSAQTSIQLEADLSHFGSAKAELVELSLLRMAARESVKRSEFFEKAERKATRSVTFPDGQSKRTVSFQLTGLPTGFYQGALRFSSDDALAEDNIRWFSFDIRNDSKILVAAPDPIEKKALFVREALAPLELRKTGNAPFDLEIVSLAKLAKMNKNDLMKYQAVLILDPDRSTARNSAKLLDFARSGGGVGIFLGRNTVPTEFQTVESVDLLGGRPSQQVRVPDWSVSLMPRGYENGVLTSFRSFSQGTDIPWSALTVSRYWFLKDLSSKAVRLIDYSDGRPALYTRSIGNGTVLVATFPISDLPDEDPWNLIPAGDASWIFLVTMDGIARHLIAGKTSALNYLAGEPVTLRPSNEKAPNKATLILPNGEKLDLTAEKANVGFTIPRVKETGPYAVTADTDSLPVGFSVNFPAGDFDLSLMPAEDIEAFFPQDTARWIGENDDLDAARTRQRIGRELYPYLLLLLTGLVFVEYLFSNRFYEK